MDGTGRLLLVEDEDGLRGLVAHFLRLEGFEVTEARDGLEAVGFLDPSRPGRFDLAMVDLNLPELNGVEVCRHARRVLPDLPLLICSASIHTEHESTLRSMGVERFLTKPYHPARLVEMIREDLERPAVPRHSTIPGLTGAELPSTFSVSGDAAAALIGDDHRAPFFRSGGRTGP